jgi:hypothetical protein
MSNGRLPPSIEAEIAASRDPEHARAQLLLAAIRAPVEPDEEDEDEGAGAKILAPPKAGEAAPPADGAVPSVAESTAPSVAPEEVPAAAKPKLAVVTRMSVEKKGIADVLVFHASSGLDVGIARQPSGVVRLVVKSSGALPPVLSARPKVNGFVVEDVKRGDGTLQVTVRPKAGFIATVRSFAGGAKVRFEPP